MNEATITYGRMEQPLHTNGQYLLMEAGLEDGKYSTADFIAAIDGVDLSGLAKIECRRDVRNQRTFLRAFAEIDETVTISGFRPDRAQLERFVNTTFAEMRAEMERGR